MASRPASTPTPGSSFPVAPSAGALGRPQTPSGRIYLMSPPTQAAPDSISHLLALADQYPAPQVVAANAMQQDFQGEYRRSIEDPDGFWGEQARGFHWDRPWEQVLDG